MPQYILNSKNRIQFPRIGAFEVHFRGKRIQSKLKIHRFPYPKRIIKVIEEVINDKEVRGKNQFF